MKIETYARPAALFLTIVLLVGLYALHNPTVADGHWVYLSNCDTDLGDDRLLVLQIAADLSLKINQDAISRETFPHPLPEIYQTKSTKRLFVVASSNLSYQQVMEDMAKAQEGTPDLHVFLITPSQEQTPCILPVPSGPVTFRYPSATREEPR